jgi:hypothetical protein
MHKERERKSSVYPLEKFSILVHILYRHAELNLDGSYNIADKHDMVDEYHFYVSDDSMHDIFFVQHCFDLLYKELRNSRVTFKEYWAWLEGCVGKF